MIVPLAAMQRDGDSDYVYVAAGWQVRAARRVSWARSATAKAALSEAVCRPGERVVTHGALFLGDQSNSGG